MACNEDEYRSKARARAQKNRCYRAPTGRARQAPTRLSNSAVFGCSCAIEHDVSVWPNAADNPAISTYQLRNCHIPIVMLRASTRQPRAPRRRMASLSIALGRDASVFELDGPLPEIPESNASKSGRERAIERSRAAAPQLLPPRIRGEDPARAFRIAPPREPPLPEAGPLSRSPAGTV
jgi:hypothetical protein